MNHKQQEMLSRMRDVLGEKFLTFSALSYAIREDFETEQADISCTLTIGGGPPQPEVIEVHGRGTGLVDALFHGLKDRLAQQYPSLNSIQFSKFSVDGIMSTRQDQSGSDAEAQVTLTVLSSELVEFNFASTSRSVARASVDAVLQAVAYFVNSERTFIEIYNILQHYRRENRVDLVTKYQIMLGQMVENTSYTEVIHQIRSKELKRP